MASLPTGFDVNQLKVEALAVKCQCYLALYEQLVEPVRQSFPKSWDNMQELNSLANEAMNKLRKEKELTREKKYILVALESALEAVSLQEEQNPELVNFVKEALFEINRIA